MQEFLRQQLRARGWKPGRYKGFLQTSRAGIEFNVGRPVASERLAVRYRYHTERTHAEGEVPLPADATPEQVEETLTDIYLRVHEKPDYARAFARKRPSRPTDTPPAPAPDDPDTQLDLGL